MKPLTIPELLSVWDETAGRPLIEKMVRLLAKASFTGDFNEVLQLSIGERDARLLQIREWLFGNRLKNKVDCPSCHETLEWESDTRNLHLQTISQDAAGKEFTFQIDNYTVKFRLPNSSDIIQLLEEQAGNDPSEEMAAKCILSIKKNDAACTFNELPINARESLNDYMSLLDPQADIRINLVCPACRHCWQMCFDIGAYLWEEINHWAKKMLHEVFLLAAAFGWTESEILGLSNNRRRMYLQMIEK